jgi:hypothetical protein
VTPSYERKGGKEPMFRTEAKVQQMLKKNVDPVYRELSAKLKEPNSEIMPRLLEKMMNLEQAKIINALPASPADIAQQLNLDKATVDKHMQEMFEKGLLYPGKTGWHMTRSWAELHDSAGSANPKYDNDEFFDLAFAESDEQVKKRIDEVLKGEAKVIRQSMRVVPRWKSIKDIPGVLPCEDIRQIFAASNPIAPARRLIETGNVRILFLLRHASPLDGPHSTIFPGVLGDRSAMTKRWSFVIHLMSINWCI